MLPLPTRWRLRASPTKCPFVMVSINLPNNRLVNRPQVVRTLPSGMSDEQRRKELEEVEKQQQDFGIEH